MAYTAPRTWVANETVTAALMNTHIRDNEIALYGTDSTYTPQIDQGATTNIAKTVNEARYVQVGRIVHVWVFLTLTAAGTAGSSATVTLPVTASGHAAGAPVGHCLVYDTSTTTRYNGNAEIVSTTTVGFGVDGVNTGPWGATPNLALASGDQLRFHATYIVA